MNRLPISKPRLRLGTGLDHRLDHEPLASIETTVKVYSVVKDCSLVMIAKRLKCELLALSKPPLRLGTGLDHRLDHEPLASIETTVKTSHGLDHRLDHEPLANIETTVKTWHWIRSSA